MRLVSPKSIVSSVSNSKRADLKMDNNNMNCQEVYSLLSEQLMVSQSHVIDFLHTHILSVEFTELKTRLNDIFSGISNAMRKILANEDTLSVSFNESRPISRSKRRSFANIKPVRSSKIHLLTKENEHLKQKLITTEQERKLVKARAEELAKVVNNWQTKFKSLSGIVNNFLRNGESKAKLEKNIKEIIIEDQNFQKNKIIKLNAELKEKASKIASLEQELQSSQHQKDKIMKNYKNKIKKLQKTSRSNTNNENKNSDSLQLNLQYSALEEEQHKIESSCDLKSYVHELFSNSVAEFELKIESLNEELNEKDRNLDKLRVKVKEILEDNLKTIIELNLDLAKRDANEEKLYEEKCLLEFTLNNNETWTQAKISDQNQVIEGMIHEKQEYETAYANLLAENHSLSLKLIQNEFKEHKEPSTFPEDFLDEKGLQIQSLLYQKQRLESENQDLMKIIQDNEKKMIKTEQNFTEEIEKANLHIESLIFTNNSLKNEFNIQCS